MNKKAKTVVVVVVCLIVVAIMLHLTVNYVVPFVTEMHKGVAAY